MAFMALPDRQIRIHNLGQRTHASPFLFAGFGTSSPH